MEVRALQPSDDRSRFRSGDSDLDRFFGKYAGQNQFRHNIGVTYVAVEAGFIAGYVTVSPGHLKIEDLTLAQRRRLPSYPLPILRLARLAVDSSFQGKGVGKRLLHFVLTLALRMAREFGCTGVVADAKAGAVSFYEGFGFLSMETVEGQSAARPPATSMFLPIAEVMRVAKS